MSITTTGQAEAIQAAALTVFSTDGYAGASLQRIAEVAGCTKANVLYHFGSKEGLLNVALEAAEADARARLEGLAGTSADPIASIVDLFLAHSEAARLMLFHTDTLPGTHHSEAVTAIFEQLGEAVAGGDDAARARFAIACAGLAFLLSAPPSYTRGECTPQEVVDLSRDELVAILHQMIQPTAA